MLHINIGKKIFYFFAVINEIHFLLAEMQANKQTINQPLPIAISRNILAKTQPSLLQRFLQLIQKYHCLSPPVVGGRLCPEEQQASHVWPWPQAQASLTPPTQLLFSRLRAAGQDPETSTTDSMQPLSHYKQTERCAFWPSILTVKQRTPYCESPQRPFWMKSSYVVITVGDTIKVRWSENERRKGSWYMRISWTFTWKEIGFLMRKHIFSAVRSNVNKKVSVIKQKHIVQGLSWLWAIDFWIAITSKYVQSVWRSIRIPITFHDLYEETPQFTLDHHDCTCLEKQATDCLAHISGIICSSEMI